MNDTPKKIGRRFEKDEAKRRERLETKSLQHRARVITAMTLAEIMGERIYLHRTTVKGTNHYRYIIYLQHETRGYRTIAQFKVTEEDGDRWGYSEDYVTIRKFIEEHWKDRA